MSLPKWAQTILSPQLLLTDSDSTNIRPVFTVPAGGAVVKVVAATSNDTVARRITLLRTPSGGSAGLVDSLMIPAATTSEPVRHVNFLDPGRLTWLDPYDIQMHLGAGVVLSIKMETPISVGAEVSIFITAGEYAV